MTRVAPPLVIITGLPGSGKSTVARLLASWYRASWIPRYITRPLRPHEPDDNAENKRISNECFNRLQRDGRIFHPTRTVNDDGSEYLRGFPPVDEWPAPPPDTEVVLMVSGPRGAIEIKQLMPDAVVVYLYGSDKVLLDRLLARPGIDFAKHGQKIIEYEQLDIIREFEHAIDTDHLDSYDVARRIELIAGLADGPKLVSP